MMMFRVRRLLAWLVLGCLAAFAVFMMLRATPYGSGLNGDSFYYISGARTLAAGLGMGRIGGDGRFIPVTHFPPMLSLSLAVPQAVGLDALRAVRWMNALLLGLSVFASGLLIQRATKSTWFACLGAAWVMCSPVLLTVHSWVMSEPLYIFLSLASLLFLHHYLENHSRFALLISAALAGAAVLTRYIGGVLIVTALVVLLLSAGKRITWISRIIDITLWLALGALPLVSWLGYTFLANGSVANRKIDFLPIPQGLLDVAALSIWDWFLPGEYYRYERFLLLLAAFAGIALLGLLLWRHKIGAAWRKFRSLPSLAALMGIYAASFLAFLSVSIMFFDHNTTPDQRILSPVHTVVLILVVVGLSQLWRRARWGQAAAGLIFLCLFVPYVPKAYHVVTGLGRDGQAYASEDCRYSPLYRAVKELPPNTMIFTNNIIGIYFCGERSSSTIPRGQGLDEKGKAAYASELAYVRNLLKQNKAVLVVVNPDSLEPFQIPYDVLVEGLERVVKSYDGEMFLYKPNGRP